MAKCVFTAIVAFHDHACFPRSQLQTKVKHPNDLRPQKLWTNGPLGTGLDQSSGAFRKTSGSLNALWHKGSSRKRSAWKEGGYSHFTRLATTGLDPKGFSFTFMVSKAQSLCGAEPGGSGLSLRKKWLPYESNSWCNDWAIVMRSSNPDALLHLGSSFSIKIKFWNFSQLRPSSSPVNGSTFK